MVVEEADQTVVVVVMPSWITEFRARAKRTLYSYQAGRKTERVLSIVENVKESLKL